jgi:hypothetical protein
MLNLKRKELLYMGILEEVNDNNKLYINADIVFKRL